MKGQNQKNVLQLCRKSMPSCILTPKKYLFYSKNHEKCRIVIKLSGSSLKLALFATPAIPSSDRASCHLAPPYQKMLPLKLSTPLKSCSPVLHTADTRESLMLVLPPAFLFPPGCRRQWDNITCWPEAQVGAVVVKPCPKYFRFLTTFLGKTSHLAEMLLGLCCL